MRDGVTMLRCTHDVHSQSVHVRRRSGKSPSFGFSQVVMYAYLFVPFRTFSYLFVPLPILSLSGVDRHDCLSPSFAVLGELWVELVLFQIAPHSVHPPQSGPSTRSPTFIVVTCFATFVSSLLITWPNHERRFWATYVVIGLTIASLLNFSFLIRSFLVLP